MKSTITFKKDDAGDALSARRLPRTSPPRSGANDNFRTLEFEIEGQERDWRLLCLISAIICGLIAFIFLPLW